MSSFRNPLPGVPCVESPFFDEIFVPERYSELERRIARDLHENGFAVFDFPDADIGERAARIKAALSPGYPWDEWRRAGADMRIQDAWKFDENVRAIATNEAVLDLLTKLYGRRAFPFQTLSFPVGTEQHFHTDSIHFSSVPERFMCGVWVALEDIESDQGPLEYYPGSHRWPIYTNEHIGFVPQSMINNQSTYHELWTRLVQKSGGRRDSFRPRKGQALIWAANLLHGGMPHQNKEKTRWSQVTHYYFEDCAYFTPMHSDPFRGLIAFRQLEDIVNGLPVLNAFSGKAVPAPFIELTNHGFDRPRRTRDNFWRRIRRKLKIGRS